MKHFYLKSVIALIIIALTLGVAVKLVYPDKSNSDALKAENQLIRTLSKENVHISSALLDFELHEVFDTSMVNSFDITSLAKQYLGKNAVRHDDTTYRSNAGILTFKNSHMTYTPSAPLFAATTRNITLSGAGTAAERICAEYGIPVAGAQLGVSGGKDKIMVSVTYELDSLPVFNNALVMELSQNGLHSISGVYFKSSGIKENVRYAKKMEEALLDFVHECTDKSRETVITDIELGYMLDDTETQSTTVSPVWRIIVDDSAVYYVEA